MPKSPSVENFLDELALLSGYTITRSNALKKKICIKCNNNAKIFKNYLNKKEYKISALCQKCQDNFFEKQKL